MQSTQHQSQSKIHSQKVTQSAPQPCVEHAKDTGVGTFSSEKLGKFAPFAAGPPEVGAQGRPIRISARFHSSQVPERAHTLCGCGINGEDLLLSPKDFVGCVSTPLGNLTSDTCS